MLKYRSYYETNNYHEILDFDSIGPTISIGDHLGGFDVNLNNKLLKHVNDHAQNSCIVKTGYIASPELEHRYPNLDFCYDYQDWIWGSMSKYFKHPEISYKNFVCSFNGSDHVSRQLLTAILNRFGYFAPGYSSKNFIYSADTIDGHIFQHAPDNDRFYRKFFIGNDSDSFFQTVYSFGHLNYDHARNIYNLENQLTGSFLHVVSETMSTSYYPFVTEKFLYSVVTRGLFVAYAHPGWHAHLEKYYGFKKYNKLFNYTFDSVTNSVERLVELITMISKFEKLSTDDWHDLYLIEQDTIEYNYNHYFSGDYLKLLEKV